MVRTSVVAGAILVLGILVGLVRPWSARVMNSGVYTYASQYQDMIDRVRSAPQAAGSIRDLSPWQLWKMAMQQYSLLYHSTGPAATVSVMERQDGIRFLTIDGKTDASSSFDHDMRTQIMLGQLPLLLHEAPETVFVVGLGSGVTVGSILTHPVGAVDCAEFSTGVIRAAACFADVNHNALDDPRLQIVPRDARNVLLTRGRSYDIIVSQPSNPWISGQSSLFSHEWYEIVSDHLNRGGIFAQWVPTYHMSVSDVRIILHTLRGVFPHITAWTSGCSGELIFVATKAGPLRIPYSRFQARAACPRVQQDLGRLGYDPNTVLSQTFVMGEADVFQYIYPEGAERLKRNTDDLLITEFNTPKQMAHRRFVERFASEEALRGNPASLSRILIGADAPHASSLPYGSY